MDMDDDETLTISSQDAAEEPIQMLCRVLPQDNTISLELQLFPLNHQESEGKMQVSPISTSVILPKSL